MATYSTNSGTITVHWDTHKGSPEIMVTNVEDDTVSHTTLDNYQAYQLALQLLAHLDVMDTRGSR